MKPKREPAMKRWTSWALALALAAIPATLSSQSSPAPAEASPPSAAPRAATAPPPGEAATEAAAVPPLPTAPQPPAANKPGNVKEWLLAHPSTVKTTILGAAGGALLGLLAARGHGAGSAWKGALIGGAAGGVAGYLVGKTKDRLAARRAAAVQMAGYDPSQGYVLRLESVTSAPATAAPGDTVSISLRYLVIGPDPNEKITIHCFRGIKFQDTYLAGDGPAAVVVPNGGGVVISDSTITLAKEAPAGTYTVEAIVEDSQGGLQQIGTSQLYIGADQG